MRRFPESHLHLAGFVLAVMAGAYFLLPAERGQAGARGPAALTAAEAARLAAGPPLPPAYVAALESYPPLPPSYFVAGIHVQVQRGDTLSRIFQRHEGLDAAELPAIMRTAEADYLKTLRPNDQLIFKLSGAGELAALSYRKAEGLLKVLHIARRPDSDGGFTGAWETIPTVTHVAYKEGYISVETPTLWEAGEAAGLSASLISELADIFQWDISFALDVRFGDSFSVLFEETYAQGARVGAGRILAAKFNTSEGEQYEAVYYGDASVGAGYFTPDGRPMQKAFMRDPVSFLFVSSEFDPDRMHPIHQRRIPHKGTDYAAKVGTPVKATGLGVVKKRRFATGPGNYVVLQHGKQFTTKYMHLSRFAEGLAEGQTVQQGEVIGYVGKTGLATAAHLHYEFLVNGVHRNSLTYPIPDRQDVTAEEMPRFREDTLPILARLDKSSADQQIASRALPPLGAVGTVGR